MCIFSCCCSGYDTSYDDIILNKGKRSCTDCFFLLVFVLFVCGLGTTTFYAFKFGDPYRILYGSDSFGNTCGRPNLPLFVHIDESNSSEVFPFSGSNMEQKRFMFPLNITQPLDTIWVCVNQCPEETIVSMTELNRLESENNNSLCVPPIFHEKRTCPRLPVHKSVSIINRCIPEDILMVGEGLVQKIVAMDYVRGYLNDIVKAFPVMLRMCAVAFVISLVSVFVLRYFAGFVVYLIYLLVFIVFGVITGVMWYSVYLTFDTESQPSPEALSTLNPQIKLSKLFKSNMSPTSSWTEDWFKFDYKNRNLILGIAIGVSVLSTFVMVIVWCLVPRGKKMVLLFEKASRALWAMPLLLFQPVISAFCVVLIATYSISVGFILFTAGEPVARVVSVGDDDNITVIEHNVTEVTRMMIIYQAVGFIWLCEFVMAYQRLFIAGAISLWYFNTRRSEPGQSRSTACSSIHNLIRYHLGSAALGSLIITLVRIPRYILMWIYAKLTGIENEILRKLLACFICILGCIERCLNYINYNAYTVIAYSGMSFCPAAKVAVNIILDNAVDVAMINTVGDAVLFLAKCVVAVITATITLFTMDKSVLNHPWLPIILVFISSYMIANCFFSIYEMAIDALFLCCAEDNELSQDNPNHELSNKEFRNFIEMNTFNSSSDRRYSSNDRRELEQSPLNSQRF